MAVLRRLQPGQFAILGVVVIGSLLMVTRDQWDWLLADGDPQTTDVEAPTIAVEEVDEETQRLYRISPNNGSEVRYVVTERLAGTEKTTVGTLSYSSLAVASPPKRRSARRRPAAIATGVSSRPEEDESPTQ